MKKTAVILILATLFIPALNVFATAPAGFSGGVYNEYQYEEIVFITGEPIKFIGELEVKEKKKDNLKTVEYKFDLKTSPEYDDLDGELRRKIKLEITYDDRDEKGQVISHTKLDKYKEDIKLEGKKIGKVQYELEDFQLSKSDVIDKRPASDYYQGNIKGRKYYTINDDEGTVIVDITGGDVGYENFWGDTETKLINYTISYNRLIPEEDDDKEAINWTGTVMVNVSDSTTKNLIYNDNQANLSSFNGGYIKTENREVVSKYTFNLPNMRSNKYYLGFGNTGQIQLSKKMVPKIERLIVPKFRDLAGHLSKSQIEKLYSLGIFEGKKGQQFFSPDIPITRGEFTKALVKICDIKLEDENKKRTISIRGNNKAKEEPLNFIDIKKDDQLYKYVKAAHEKGIIEGITPLRFKPKSTITKAQAITSIIRALGFQNKAPNPGYYTSFTDSNEIPYWAKDSIYIANEIDIINGNEAGKIYPNKELTRAETSQIFVRLLKFLERDLQKDYREKIILFN